MAAPRARRMTGFCLPATQTNRRARDATNTGNFPVFAANRCARRIILSLNFGTRGRAL